ncbi:MAG: class II glutamine amidotransferase [Symploca sp. SIO2E6]|nr:class II glutamine amidotransferase [Symploca sp. SIO2E6]
MKQTYAPQMLKLMNLAGFGMAAWEPMSHNPEEPFIYKTVSVPFFDRNLKVLAQKLRPTCLVAHVRGVISDPSAKINIQNVHPFQYKGFKLAMAHNGDLADMDKIKFSLLESIKPEIARQMEGTTDSEWIYALLMSQVEDPTKDLELDEILPALESTLKIIKQVRKQQGIAVASWINLFICDGNDLVATRFTFDFGCYTDKIDEFGFGLADMSLWYTLGQDYGWHKDEWKLVGSAKKANSVIVASEPLSKDITNWTEVPEYSVLYVKSEGDYRQVKIADLDI